MSKLRPISFILTSGILLTACNDQNTLNEKNIKNAIQNSLNNQSGVCIVLPENKLSLPDNSLLNKIDLVSLPENSPYNRNDIVVLSKEVTKDNAKEYREIEALESIDFVTKTTKTIEVKGLINNKNIDANVYTLTDKAKKFFQQKENNGKISRELCSGRYIVDKIIDFTTPENNADSKTSTVNYTAKIEDWATWSKNPKMTNVFPNINPLAEPIKRKMVITLTDNGWKGE